MITEHEAYLGALGSAPPQEAAAIRTYVDGLQTDHDRWKQAYTDCGSSYADERMAKLKLETKVGGLEYKLENALQRVQEVRFRYRALFAVFICATAVLGFVFGGCLAKADMAADRFAEQCKVKGGVVVAEHCVKELP